MLRYVLLTLAVLAGTHQVLAHSWYPAACCSGTDCAPVACESIDERSGGVMTWNGWVYTPNQIKISQDVGCHACHYGPHDEAGADRPGLCLFILPTA